MASLAELFVFTYITSNELSRRRPRYDNCREEWHGATRVDQIARPRQAGRSKVRLRLCDDTGDIEGAEVEGVG